MRKKELLKEFYEQDEIGKEIILEKFVFCHFADEQNFENYFKIDELGERELFSGKIEQHYKEQDLSY